eukprot:TRINITY_DN16358_c0_g2_i6.p1 TRINITY_DN16358_c0_g2~~TRINITY_DN16358_c0_g2_i6.p1  ORF type:complete len:110 (-),score=25.88 TRINITY_DN16358_c0_g2_i6:320-649(-)
MCIRDRDKEFNQYWYSKDTIDFIVSEVTAYAKRAAFLSTPSVYFSLKDPIKSSSRVFELDKKFSSDPNFVYYDFNKPTEVPEIYKSYFDFIVIDPPFITHDVLAKVNLA